MQIATTSQFNHPLFISKVDSKVLCKIKLFNYVNLESATIHCAVPTSLWFLCGRRQKSRPDVAALNFWNSIPSVDFSS